MRKWPWVIGITVFVIFIVLAVLGYRFQWDWTGLPEHVGPNTQQYQPAKTAWDWLQLAGVLAIPAAVWLGTMWFTTKQAQESSKENTDNQQEASLQAYIDKMSELLLANNLRKSQDEDEVRNIARVRTLTVLRRLDPTRKTSVLLFLHESELIDKDKCVIDLKGADLSFAHLGHAILNKHIISENRTIIVNAANLSEVNLVGANLNGASLAENSLYNADLSGADLNKADLSHAYLDSANLNKAILVKANLSHSDLSFVDLVGASLVGTNLRGAKLLGANLSEANLSRANLEGADLSEADLSGANLTRARGVTDEQLSQAKSLQGTTMHDGTKHL